MSFEPTIKNLIDDIVSQFTKELAWERITFYIRANSQRKENEIHRKVFDYAVSKNNNHFTPIDIYMILHENVILGLTKDTRYIKRENIVTLLQYYQAKNKVMDYNFKSQLSEGYEVIKLMNLTVDDILSMKIHKNLYDSHSQEDLIAIALLGCR